MMRPSGKGIDVRRGVLRAIASCAVRGRDRHGPMRRAGVDLARHARRRPRTASGRRATMRRSDSLAAAKTVPHRRGFGRPPAESVVPSRTSMAATAVIPDRQPLPIRTERDLARTISARRLDRFADAAEVRGYAVGVVTVQRGSFRRMTSSRAGRRARRWRRKLRPSVCVAQGLAPVYVPVEHSQTAAPRCTRDGCEIASVGARTSESSGPRWAGRREFA